MYPWKETSERKRKNICYGSSLIDTHTVNLKSKSKVGDQFSANMKIFQMQPPTANKMKFISVKNI